MHTQSIQNHSPIPRYNPESADSQAPGPDVRACRRRSDIPCQGGQYVPTVVSRHCIACETLTVRKSSYNQASISHICSGLVPQSQAITTTSQSPETLLKGNNPHVMHCHTYATWHPHATPPCMRALAPGYDSAMHVDYHIIVCRAHTPSMLCTSAPCTSFVCKVQPTSLPKLGGRCCEMASHSPCG